MSIIEEKENLFRIDARGPVPLPGELYSAVRGLLFIACPPDGAVPVEGRLAGSDAELDALFDALRAYFRLGGAAVSLIDWVLVPKGFRVAQGMASDMALDPERSAQIVKAKNMLAQVSFAPLDPLPEIASGAYLGSLALTVVGSMKEALGACPEVPGAERTLAAALERCLPHSGRASLLGGGGGDFGAFLKGRGPETGRRTEPGHGHALSHPAL